MIAIMTSVAKATANQGLASFCLSQLPRGIRDQFECVAESDAYMLRPLVRFKHITSGTVYDCCLEEWRSDDKNVDGLMLKVPEDFIAKLCVAT